MRTRTAQAAATATHKRTRDSPTTQLHAYARGGEKMHQDVSTRVNYFREDVFDLRRLTRMRLLRVGTANSTIARRLMYHLSHPHSNYHIPFSDTP